MKRTAADDLLDVLASWGVSKIFSCPGSTEAAILDALMDRDDIELFLTTHESAAVSIADGYSRATGAPSVVYLHANGGLTNGLANLAAAQLAYSPVIVLNGLKPRSIQSRAGFTTARRMRDFVHQYVKDDWQSLTSEGIAEDVNRALRTAMMEPAGPVWVGLSQDLLEAPSSSPVTNAQGFRFDSRTVPPPSAIRAAADLFSKSRHPVIIAGSEVARAGAIEDVIRLSEALRVPVLHEDRRALERPGFPTDHPNFRGQYEPTHPLVQGADLLVFLGARLFNEFEPPTSPQLPVGAKIIHSHTDAHHIALIHGVDVGLVGDQALIAQELLAALLQRLDRDEFVLPEREAEREQETSTSRHGALQALDVVDVITDALRGAVLVGDATTAGGVLQTRAHQHSGNDYFVSSSGSLGWGMGAALGIKMALPERRVAAILGDGVFQFGIPALWSAARQNIPVTYVVINNQRYAAVGAALQRYKGKAAERKVYPGTDIAGVNIAEASSAFGVPGQRVDSLEGLRSAIDAAEGVEHPVLIEVMTDPEQLRP
ncbi:MAG: thiamine pyrophosphate-binding protein [Lacisediminihabitans sp.]